MAVDPRAGERGSTQAVIRRADGSTQIVDRSSGRVIQETNPQGVQVIRLARTSGGTGRGSGASQFQQITDQQQTQVQDRILQEQKAQREKEQQQASSSFRQFIEDPVTMQTTEINQSFVEREIMSRQANISLPSATIVTVRGDNITREETGSREGFAAPPVVRQDETVDQDDSRESSRDPRFRVGDRLIRLSDEQLQDATRSFSDAGTAFSQGRIGSAAVSGLDGILGSARTLVSGVSGEIINLGALGAAAGEGVVRFARNPVPPLRSTADFFGRFATDRDTRVATGVAVTTALGTAGSSLGREFQTNPIRVTGSVFTGTGLGRAAREVGRVSRNVVIATGSRRIPATQVFDDAALAGRTRFPTAQSTDEIITAFQRSNFEFVTASPRPLTGQQVALAGRGLAGTEGSTLSVTPLGTGSPAFLGLRREGFVSGSQLQFSLNPFAPVRPTATAGRATGIIETPRSVTRVPGFEAENIFMREQVAGTGLLVIPKRVQIGQGVISPQEFQPLVRSTPLSPGVLGSPRLERGTTELEAGLPLGQLFTRSQPSTTIGRLKGFDEFTTVDGFNVPLRRIDLIVDRELGSGSVFTPLSQEFIDSARTGFSSSIRPQTRVVSPLTFTPSLSTFSSPTSVSSFSSSSSLSSGFFSVPPDIVPSSSGVTSNTTSQNLASTTAPSSSFSVSRRTGSTSFSPSSSSLSSSVSSSGVSSPLSSSLGRSSSSSAPPSSSPGSSSSTTSSLSSTLPPSSTQSILRSSRFNLRSRFSERRISFTIGRPGNINFKSFTASDLGLGVRRARGIVDRTLAASFRVEGLSPQEKRLVDSLLGGNFRRSRVEGDRFVERRRFRLGSRSEVEDIQRSRRDILKGTNFSSSLKLVNSGVPLRNVRRLL